jgi:hypothetical protein
MGTGLPPEGAEREQLFWLLQIEGWSAVGVLSMYPLIQIFNPRAVAVIMGLRIGTGLLLTWGMRWVYQRIGWRNWPWWQLFVMVLCACFVLGAVDSVGTHLLAAHVLVNRWIPQPSRELQSFVLPMGVLLRWSLLVIWSLLYFGIKLWLETAAARLQAAESEAAARTSELRQLRAQVNPHFLFNALNSVLAEKDNASAVELITLELAEYLRFSLRPAGDCQTLGEELDALEHYLRVEKARYEEKLEYVIEAEPQVRRVRVPVATVQPLLENAMKYGRQTSPVPLRVVLSAALDRETGALRITVRNTGRWLEFDATRSHGIGLANLRRRLELLFGAEGQLTHGVDDGWVWVEVTLPADTKVEEAATNGMREGIA